MSIAGMTTAAARTLRTRTTQALQDMRDAINPEAAKDRKHVEHLAQLRATRRQDDIRWLLQHQQGRRILYQLLDDCGHQGSTLNAHGRPSPVLEGRRSIAIEMAADIAPRDPEAWLLMLREAMTDALRA